MSQGQSLGRDRSGRGWAGDAHDVEARLGQRDGEGRPDGTGPEDSNRGRSRHGSKAHVRVSDTVPKV
jgi:hypothetical protein